jgi:hypothetical protein
MLLFLIVKLISFLLNSIITFLKYFYRFLISFSPIKSALSPIEIYIVSKFNYFINSFDNLIAHIFFSYGILVFTLFFTFFTMTLIGLGWIFYLLLGPWGLVFLIALNLIFRVLYGRINFFLISVKNT